jgi:phospho-N-acetylmuramoyl-pentapeptide-transferase
MLYYLLYVKLYPFVSPLRVFRFVTFRAAFASLTALFLGVLLGPWFIAKLRQMSIGQHIREEGPGIHLCVDRHARAHRLRCNWLHRRLRQAS